MPLVTPGQYALHDAGGGSTSGSVSTGGPSRRHLVQSQSVLRGLVSSLETRGATAAAAPLFVTPATETATATTSMFSSLSSPADNIQTTEQSSFIRQVFHNSTENTSSFSTLDLLTKYKGGDVAATTAGFDGSTGGGLAWNLSWNGYLDTTDSNVSLSAEDVEFNLVASVFAGIALGTICFMTIGGNVLVLLAVFVNSHLRSTTNYFIVNLAIADLLLGTAVLPFSASLEIVNYWAFGQIFCDIWAAVDVLCCTASIMSLCVISIDRYIGVTRPLQHSTIMTERRAFYIIILVWALAIAISVAPLFGWKDPPPDATICEVTMQLGYVLFSVSGSFYIPLIIILVVYFRVYREALSQSRFLMTGVKISKMDESNSEVTLRIHTGRPQQNAKSNHYQSSSSSEHSEGSGKKNHSKLSMAGKVAKFKREKKAAKTLGIVVGVFILCWFPFFFILPLEALCGQCNIPPWLFKTMFWLGYCNSMMNPIIYACSSREFKRAFTRILACKWRRKPRSFIDDLSLSAPSTEMSKLTRFSSVRRFSFRPKKRETLSRTYSYSMGSAGRRFLLQATNGRGRVERESPIASLRLLQNQQRHATVDNVTSDGEYADSTDDERSDGSNEEALEGKGLMTLEHKTDLEDKLDTPQANAPPATEYHVANRKDNRKRRKYRQELAHAVIPDIIIDDAEVEPLNVSTDAQERAEAHLAAELERGDERHVSAPPCGLSSPALSSTQSVGSSTCQTSSAPASQGDNIMWL